MTAPRGGLWDPALWGPLPVPAAREFALEALRADTAFVLSRARSCREAALEWDSPIERAELLMYALDWLKIARSLWAKLGALVEIESAPAPLCSDCDGELSGPLEHGGTCPACANRAPAGYLDGAGQVHWVGRGEK